MTLLEKTGLPRTRELREALHVPRRRFALRGWKSKYGDWIARADFFRYDDTKVVEMLGRAFAPEFESLKSASSTAESNTVTVSLSKPTLGALGPKKDCSPSRLLYGQDFTEVNRTIVGVLALKWIISNDYDTFTCQQFPAVKLRKESFDILRQRFLDYLLTDEATYGLIVSMIINDLGKDPELERSVRNLNPKNNTRLNHDEVINVAAENGLLELLKEYDDGPHLLRKDDDLSTLDTLRGGLEIGTKLNLGQLAQAENVPGNLVDVFKTPRAKKAFPLKFMEIVLDVAGADGHNDSRCAKSWIEPVNMTFNQARLAIEEMLKEGRSIRDAYDEVLVQRSRLLRAVGFKQLSVKVPEQRALLRMLTMGRTTTKEQAEMFEQAFDSMDPEDRRRLVEGLSVDGIDDGIAILPYYMPAMFAGGIKTTSQASDEIKVRAIRSLMQFLKEVLRGTKPEHGHPGRVVECDIGFAQNVVKDERFLQDPEILVDLKIPPSAYNDYSE